MKGAGIRRATYMITAALIALCLLASSATAAKRNDQLTPCAGKVTAKQFKPFSTKVWALERWRRGAPKPSTVQRYRAKLDCAAGPRHREAAANRWSRDRTRFGQNRRRHLAAHSINYRWGPHWAPDWSGPKLPMYQLAALAEKAGDVVGVDVPGWTMAEVTLGESNRRPGSAGVDAGGTRGYGLWAITWPFANDILARYGWSYEDMWNPVLNSVAMAHIYGRQGLGAWYGDRYITHPDRHYRGRFDLRLALDGLSFRQAIGR